MNGLMKLNYLIAVFLLLTLGLYFYYALSLPREIYWYFVVLLLLPLCLPISGTLKGKAYTIGYSSLLSTWYFFVSATIFIFYDAKIMVLATLTSFLWFITCVLHNRRLKKLKKQQQAEQNHSQS